tara:strand:+ start:413 stop:1006 length:594 start_codon:yes stop_codon:yes gene_type:complete
MKSVKAIFFFSIALLFTTVNSFSKDPSLLINEIVNEASAILSSQDPVEAKIIKLNNLAEINVDINGIALYALGKHRKTISSNDKVKYLKLFRSYFLKTFSSRLVDYSDPKINIVDQKFLNKNYTIVNTKLEATKKNPEINISWRIYTKDPDRPLIRDLIIEELSLARAQKEEFNSIIQNNDGNIDALFKKLEEFIIK